jgi:hypothetical protein
MDRRRSAEDVGAHRQVCLLEAIREGLEQEAREADRDRAL